MWHLILHRDRTEHSTIGGPPTVRDTILPCMSLLVCGVDPLSSPFPVWVLCCRCTVGSVRSLLFRGWLCGGWRMFEVTTDPKSLSSFHSRRECQHSFDSKDEMILGRIVGTSHIFFSSLFFPLGERILLQNRSWWNSHCRVLCRKKLKKRSCVLSIVLYNIYVVSTRPLYCSSHQHCWFFWIFPIIDHTVVYRTVVLSIIGWLANRNVPIEKETIGPCSFEESRCACWSSYRAAGAPQGGKQAALRCAYRSRSVEPRTRPTFAACGMTTRHRVTCDYCQHLVILRWCRDHLFGCSSVNHNCAVPASISTIYIVYP